MDVERGSTVDVELARPWGLGLNHVHVVLHNVKLRPLEPWVSHGLALGQLGILCNNSVFALFLVFKHGSLSKKLAWVSGSFQKRCKHYSFGLQSFCRQKFNSPNIHQRERKFTRHLADLQNMTKT